MKKILYIIAAVAAITITASCKRALTLEETIEKSYACLAAGDYLSYISYFDVKEETKESLALIMEKERQQGYEEMGGFTGYEIVKNEVAEDGLSAFVLIKYLFANGRISYDRCDYVNKDGKWLRVFTY